MGKTSLAYARQHAAIEANAVVGIFSLKCRPNLAMHAVRSWLMRKVPQRLPVTKNGRVWEGAGTSGRRILSTHAGYFVLEMRAKPAAWH
jgi:hypothetical protein